jgi:undecaprenyl-diphosphatase
MLINESSFSWNKDIFNYINHGLQNSILDNIMPIITNFGSAKWIISIVFILFIISLIAKKDKLKKVIIIFLIAIIISTFITDILKGLFLEPRPFIAFTNVHLLGNNQTPLFSFPSGETSNIFTLITAFGLNYSLKIRGKPLKLIWILLPVGIVVAFSRLYIGVHFPLDIIIGAIIGIVSAGTVSFLINKYLKIDKYLSIIVTILFVLLSIFLINELYIIKKVVHLIKTILPI